MACEHHRMLHVMFVLMFVLSTATGEENEARKNSAVIGQFKFVAYVETNLTSYTNKSVTSVVGSCTGLLLNENYIIAPAFCLRDAAFDIALEFGSTLIYSLVTVRAGTLVGAAPTYEDYGDCMQERDVPVGRISFRPQTSTDDAGHIVTTYDLALVTVDPPFDFGPCVDAIAVMKKPFPQDPDARCWTVTYSNSQFPTPEGMRGHLKFRRVLAGDVSFCKQLQKDEKIVWENEHICSKTMFKIDTCDEDWSGPLLCETKFGMRVAGMDTFYFGTQISWLKTACRETDKLYKAYTMLGYYQEWIASVINGTTEVSFDPYESPRLRHELMGEIRRKSRRRSRSSLERRPRVATIFLLIYLILIT